MFEIRQTRTMLLAALLNSAHGFALSPPSSRATVHGAPARSSWPSMGFVTHFEQLGVETGRTVRCGEVGQTVMFTEDPPLPVTR